MKICFELIPEGYTYSRRKGKVIEVECQDMKRGMDQLSALIEKEHGFPLHREQLGPIRIRNRRRADKLDLYSPVKKVHRR